MSLQAFAIYIPETTGQVDRFAILQAVELILPKVLYSAGMTLVSERQTDHERA